jgi:hypothetical protein
MLIHPSKSIGWSLPVARQWIVGTPGPVGGNA